MAARQANPVWPWLAAGAAAAAGVGAYVCWPREITQDTVHVQGVTIRREIYFEGCWKRLPYRATFSFPNATASRSFKTLEEAQSWVAVPEDADGAAAPEPASGGLAGNPLRIPGTPRSGGKPAPEGKEPIVCEHGMIWDPVLRTCKPGKAPKVPTGKLPQTMQARRPIPAGNPFVTIFNPGLYGYGWAPYYYPQIAHGGYGTAVMA